MGAVAATAASKMAKPAKVKKQGAPARAAAAQKQLRTGKAGGVSAPKPAKQGAPARAASVPKQSMGGGKAAPQPSMSSWKQKKV